MSVFVDTSAWFAAINTKDQNHAAAATVLRSRSDFVTSDFALVETWLLVKNRIEFSAAQAFWAGIRNGIAQLERVSSADLDAAWMIGQRFPDQHFSLVDLTSFALCERLGISAVFSFDADFAVYRYGPLRERAFELVR